MKTLIFIFVFLISSLTVIGQSDTLYFVKISGVVFDEDSLSPLPNVHLIIANRNIGTVTNLQGRFEATFQIHDTIKFSHIGYKESSLIVSDTLLPGEYVVGVMLSRDTIIMKEVVIVPRRKDLRNEILNMNVPPDPNFEIAKRNLAISSYQGLTGKGVEWNADESYKMVKMRHEMAAMNMGMVAPTQMVGLNFLAVIPYVIYMMTREEIKPPDDVYISESEYQILLQNYLNQQPENRAAPDSVEIKNNNN